MPCFKRLGERVMARTFERQVVELRVRVALLNRFTQLGRPTTVPVVAMASLRLGLGSPRAAFDLSTKAVSLHEPLGLSIPESDYACLLSPSDSPHDPPPPHLPRRPI